MVDAGGAGRGRCRTLSAHVEQVRARHDIHFPVKVKIGNAEAMLPFRIQQVISGSNASIVTDDGRRMYVGDEYRGVALAAIDGGQVRFTGKHKVSVQW